MIVVMNVHTKSAKFSHVLFDHLLSGIASQVSKVFIRVSTHDLVDRSSQSIRNGYLGLVGGTEPPLQGVVLGSVKVASLFRGALGGLDEDLSQCRIADSAF